jgi:methyl-accepting chemotaxis protein
MKLSVKLLLPTALMGLILVVLAGVVIIGQHRVSAAGERLQRANRQMLDASEIRALSRAIQRDALNIIHEPADQQKPFDESTAKRADQMKQIVDRLIGSLDDSEKADRRLHREQSQADRRI